MATIQTIKNSKSKSYRVQFMKNGKRVSKRFSKKTDATKFLALLTLDESFSNQYTNQVLTTTSFSDAAQLYLKHYSGKCTSTPQRVKWWSKQLREFSLNQVTKKLIKQKLNQLSISKAPATVNRYKAAISAVFTYMNDEFDIQKNPAKEIRQLAENNEVDRYLNKDEIQRLLRACKTVSWNNLYILVLLALTTGARRSDLINLKWDNINFEDMTATVKKTKNGEPRVLPLTSEAIQLLKSLQPSPYDYIFYHPSNPNTPFKNFEYYWHKALLVAGISNFRFHDLRHTAGSMLAMANASTVQIADVLGHRTLNTTKRYIHLSTDHKADLINNIMGKLHE